MYESARMRGLICGLAVGCHLSAANIFAQDTKTKNLVGSVTAVWPPHDEALIGSEIKTNTSYTTDDHQGRAYFITNDALVYVGGNTEIVLKSATWIHLKHGLLCFFYKQPYPNRSITISTDRGTMCLYGSIVWAEHVPNKSTTFVAQDVKRAAMVFPGKDVDCAVGGHDRIYLRSGEFEVLGTKDAGTCLKLPQENIADWECWEHVMRFKELDGPLPKELADYENPKQMMALAGFIGQGSFEELLADGVFDKPLGVFASTLSTIESGFSALLGKSKGKDK